MRIGVVADVHGNELALEAVLADGTRAGVERWICLGDVIGYGPDSRACVHRLHALGTRCVMGNHEARLLGLSTLPFRSEAELALEHARRDLDPEAWAVIRTYEPAIEWSDRALFCHGSPRDRDEYLFGPLQIEEALASTPRPWVFCGHTHHQGVVGNGADPRDGAPIILTASDRMLVNPGSVGQPRDGDPRAAYALVDFERRQLWLRRVSYPVEEQMARVRAAGLPVSLAERLYFAT